MKRSLNFPDAPHRKLDQGVATSWGPKGETVSPHDGKVTAFLVKKGTHATLHNVTTGQSKPYKTTKDVLFSIRQCKRDGYHVRTAGWELVVSKWNVKTTSAHKDQLID